MQKREAEAKAEGLIAGLAAADAADREEDRLYGEQARR